MYCRHNIILYYIMIHVYTSWNSLQIGKLAFVQNYPSQADKQSTQEMQQAFPQTELP